MEGIGIAGFGRIGRSTLRAALRDGLWVPAIITDIEDPETLAMLFKADTNYGLWREEVKYDSELNEFAIGARRIPYMNVRDCSPLCDPLGVKVVIDCTGRATTREGAQLHLNSGAEHVLVSAPSKTAEDCDTTILVGFNDDTFDPEKHKIVSMASCTTNALAPLVKVLEETFGIESGLFTTVHAYTASQSLVDKPMKDRAESWAAAENIIPSSSGAAKALKYLWPDLQITGKAYRVPNRTSSIVELTAVVNKIGVGVNEVNFALGRMAKSVRLGRYVDVLNEEWASARVLGETKTCLIPLHLTQVSGQLVSVASWYDNEAGYSTRLAELALRMAKA